MGKIKKAAFYLLVLLVLGACQSKIKDDLDGFAEVEEMLKSKFGKDAYYTEIDVSYDEPLGLSFSATLTEDPSSLQLEKWHWMKQGGWKQTATVTMEISGEGAKPEDFMFSLDGEVSIKQLGELSETAKKKIKEEKDIEPALNLAAIAAPDDGDKSKMEYFIQCKPKTGGTSFSFKYNLKGEETYFDY